MSAFTESALIKKLVDLNPSQQSIQTLSLWLIHHRKHHSHITKSWYNEMRKGKMQKFSVINRFWLVTLTRIDKHNLQQFRIIS